MITTSKSTKKSGTKSATSKKKQPLTVAEGERCFWACDGQILATLVDLEHALERMTGDAYAHHVNGDRNDFASWVEFVLEDTTCADGLRRARGQEAARMCVSKRLSFYL
jgi:hypothetical protein